MFGPKGPPTKETSVSGALCELCGSDAVALDLALALCSALKGLLQKKPLCSVPARLCGSNIFAFAFGFKAHRVFYLVGFLVGVDL
tara:strand:- start:202 stop:456 length:255 start_codon:yes stop_codon:yes gene_type:complete